MRLILVVGTTVPAHGTAAAAWWRLWRLVRHDIKGWENLAEASCTVPLNCIAYTISKKKRFRSLFELPQLSDLHTISPLARSSRQPLLNLSSM